MVACASTVRARPSRSPGSRVWSPPSTKSSGRRRGANAGRSWGERAPGDWGNARPRTIFLAPGAQASSPPPGPAAHTAPARDPIRRRTLRPTGSEETTHCATEPDDDAPLDRGRRGRFPLGRHPARAVRGPGRAVPTGAPPARDPGARELAAPLDPAPERPAP